MKAVIRSQVIVITRLRGLYLIYNHDTRGRAAPEGGVIVNQILPE